MNKKVKILDIYNILIAGACLMPFSMLCGIFFLNLNIILFDIIFLFTLKKDQIVNFFNKNKILITLLGVFFIANILFSIDRNISIHAFFGIIKHLILIAGFYKVINFKYLKSIFNPILLACLLFVLLNIFLQIFFGNDIFGNVITGNYRSTAVFGSPKAGSYIVKFFFLILVCNFLLNNKNYTFFYLSLFTIGIILTNGRMVTIIAIFFSTIYLLLYKDFFFKKCIKVVFFLFLCACAVFLPIKNGKNSENRSVSENLIGRTQSQFSSSSDNFSIKNLEWYQHYFLSYKIFLERPIIGSGIKTFRIYCPKIREKNYATKTYSCSTHPHHAYLEILAEGGLFGLTIFLYFLFKIFFQFVKIYIYNPKSRIEILPMFIFFFANMQPFQIMGSFFSSYAGFFYFFSIMVSLVFVAQYANSKNLN
jgi:O-antigen ligase